MAQVQGTGQWLGDVPEDRVIPPPQGSILDQIGEYETKLEEQARAIEDLNKALANGLETSELLERELERQIAARDHTIQGMERDTALFKGIVISTIKELTELLPPEKRKQVPSMETSMKSVAVALQEVREALLKEYAL
jgi:hypothetical protein